MGRACEGHTIEGPLPPTHEAEAEALELSKHVVVNVPTFTACQVSSAQMPGINELTSLTKSSHQTGDPEAHHLSWNHRCRAAFSRNLFCRRRRR